MRREVLEWVVIALLLVAIVVGLRACRATSWVMTTRLGVTEIARWTSSVPTCPPRVAEWYVVGCSNRIEELRRLWTVEW